MSEQLELIEQLIAIMPHPRWQRFLQEMHDQLQLPMSEVLAKVPGESVADKCRRLGIARNTYYRWVNESFRPSLEQARALEQLTGYPAAQIHGETDDLGRSADSSAARVAETGAKVSNRQGRVRRAVGGVALEQRKRRNARPLHRRTGGGPRRSKRPTDA